MVCEDRSYDDISYLVEEGFAQCDRAPVGSKDVHERRP